MKKIISLLLIVLFAMTAYSTQASADEDSFPKGRTAASGDEPNGDGQTVESTNQSGVTVLGAGPSQVKTCKDCEKAGNVLLSSSTRRAAPGVQQQTGAGGTGSNSGSSSNEPTSTSK